MRKLFSFSLVLILGIVLSGCDLIPSDVQDEISDLVCVDDPDNPICDLETLQNLEEDAVIDLVEEVMLKAKEKANKTKCSNLIAPGSTDLIEACSIDDDFFLPADVESFTPLVVESDGMYYKVTGVTDDDNEELSIMLKVVIVDGTYYLEDWQLTFRTLESNELTYERVKLFVSQFVIDYQDSTIPTDQFCEAYYGTPPIDEDCDGMRMEFLESEQMLEFDHLDDDDDGDGIYMVSIVVTNLDGTSEVVEVGFEVFRQDFGPVMIKRLYTPDGEDNDCDGVCEAVDLTVDEAISLFEMFVSDYLDPNKTAQELNQMYFRGYDSEFFEYRDEDLAGGLSVVVSSAEFVVDSFFDIFVEVSMDGETHDQTIRIQFLFDDMGLFFKFDNIDDDCDGVCEATDLSVEEVESFFMMFVEDYFNEMKTNDEINNMYFRGMNNEFFEYRQMDLESGLQVTVTDTQYNVDSFFDIYIEVSQDGEVNSEVLTIQMFRDDMGIFFMFLDPDDDCDGIDECYIEDVGQVLDRFNQFLMDYVDLTITDDDLYMMYGLESFPESFPARSSILDGHVTVLKISYNHDSFFDIHTEVRTSNGISHWTLEVRVNRIDMAIIVNDPLDNDCDGVCDAIRNPDEILMHFNSFLEDFMNPDITDEVLLADYTGDGLPDLVLSRANILDGHVTVLKASYSHDSFFDIFVETTDAAGVVTHWTLEVRVNRIDMAIIINDGGDPTDPLVLTPEEVAMALDQYMVRHNGMSVMSSSICPSMVVESQVDMCTFERDSRVSMGYTLSSYTQMDQGGGVYLVTFTFSAQEIMMDMTYEVMFHMGENGYLLEMYYVEPTEMEMVEDYFLMYLQYLNDPTMTTDQVCVLLSEESLDECQMLKTFVNSNMYVASLEVLDYNSDDMLVVQLRVSTIYGVLVGTIEFDTGFTMNAVGNNVLYTDQGTRANNPMYEANN